MTAFSWNFGVSGNWSTAGDWSPGGMPSTSADTADISVFGAYTATLDVSETIGALTLGNSVATLGIGSNQLTITNAGGQAGTVTITGGDILIGGGTLSATNGISVAAGGLIFGTGTLIGTIAGAGGYEAPWREIRRCLRVPARPRRRPDCRCSTRISCRSIRSGMARSSSTAAPATATALRPRSSPLASASSRPSSASISPPPTNPPPFSPRKKLPRPRGTGPPPARPPPP